MTMAESMTMAMIVGTMMAELVSNLAMHKF